MSYNMKHEAVLAQPQLIAWRREFHQCPELKMDTVITMKKITSILNEIGIEEIREYAGGSGASCLIRGAKPGKCIAVRADCDALPIREETGLPFASANGNMHACGHDAHIAMALGAAQILWAHRSEMRGTDKLIFQPYEEGDGGAKAMLADHILDNPKVDAIIAQHIGTLAGTQYPAGTICWSPTISSFAIRTFGVTFKGRGAHVSTPHEGADPLLAACYAVTQLQALISRETKPGTPAIASVSVIRGGERNNVVPGDCYMEGTIRSSSKQEQDYYYSRIREICECTAKAMRCTAEMHQIFDLMPTVNDPGMTARLLTVLPKIIPEDKIIQLSEPAPIGEDFARYADRIPAVYYFLNSAFGDTRDYPHHNSRFDINEDVLWLGCAVLSQFSFDWLQE